MSVLSSRRHAELLARYERVHGPVFDGFVRLPASLQQAFLQRLDPSASRAHHEALAAQVDDRLSLVQALLPLLKKEADHA